MAAAIAYLVFWLFLVVVSLHYLNDLTGQQNSCIHFVKASASIVFAVAILRFFMEFFQFVRSRRMYLKSYINWIEILLYICASVFSFVFLNDCVCPEDYQWQLGAFALFLAWVIFISIISKLPYIGKLFIKVYTDAWVRMCFNILCSLSINSLPYVHFRYFAHRKMYDIVNTTKNFMQNM